MYTVFTLNSFPETSKLVRYTEKCISSTKFIIVSYYVKHYSIISSVHTYTSR